MQYSPLVERYFEQPRNAGVLRRGGASTGIGIAGRTSEGARVEFYMRFADGAVGEARFRAYGCPCTIAMASRMTECVTGLSADAVERLDPHGVAAELGLPPEKLTRALLVEDAVKASLADWRRRQVEN